MATYLFENHYKDTWVKVIGSLLMAHFIRAIGSNESILEMLLQPFYYVEVLSGTVVALLTWEVVSRVTNWLDRAYDWVEHSTSRSFLQLIGGVILPSLLIFFLIYLQFKYIIQYDIFQTQWLLYEYPVSILCVITINGYYVGYYFYNQYQQTSQKLENTLKHQIASSISLPVPTSIEKASEPKLQVLIVTKGFKNVPVAVEEIAYFYIQSPHTYLKTFQDETFLITQILDELTACLPEDIFYRVNRQYIVNIKACESYVSIENGKLEVFFTPAHKEPIIVSQKKAKEFKEWVVKS
ncbi:LytTR family transcriptional regulator [Rhodocytophaga rosea]|uniref:LytTR family transcriptional regulator n=1 Tax=Rhodocytophaga rosea TaxID=2704465 RepID=A0A6C0GPL3_9BACT|nr:LytTR family DNA-binding domain-containing protein [Rhodocytophaga rosea]QHT69784.1 LytTR family transcriptional regulator [Rhodocytophaga rosea]